MQKRPTFEATNVRMKGKATRSTHAADTANIWMGLSDGCKERAQLHQHTATMDAVNGGCRFGRTVAQAARRV
jgi:hypothetical protein